jgi:hypothetical protein
MATRGSICLARPKSDFLTSLIFRVFQQYPPIAEIQTGHYLRDYPLSFADTIADYREWCKERGNEPEKPYSGTLSLRIAPELHRCVAERAAKAGESINQFIAARLEEVA